MIRVGVVTLFPQLIDNALDYGVISRARRAGLLKLELVNPRDFATDKHRSVDDRPFGGGPGMVMMPEPLNEAINACKSLVGAGQNSDKSSDEQNRAVHVVYLSPQGGVFDQSVARQWQQHGSIVLVSGRYEGVDERVIRHAVDEEVSLGNFVLSGGEIPALAVIDAVTRLEPGVLGDPMSSEEDSFGSSGLLDCPHYTRPKVYKGLEVPEVLMSGDHKAIARWRRQQALAKTWRARPELLEQAALNDEDRIFLNSLEKQRSDTDR